MSGVAEAALPWLDEPLVQALARQRAHALLVHAPAALGQFEFALLLAQAWLCETPAERRLQGRACQNCQSCQLFRAHVHPDLRVLLPEALQQTLGWAVDAEGEGDGDEPNRRKQPSKEIKVEQVRSAIAFSELTRGRGRHKVVVIFPAERLNPVAANALLKTLEEPHGDQRFVLASQAVQRLLPTLRSRCQALRLIEPPRGMALDWLASGQVDRPEVLFAATGGQPLEVLECLRAGIDARSWLALPESVRRGDASMLTGWPLARAIDALQRLCHDAMCLSAGAAPRYFAPLELPGRVDRAALLRWWRELTRAARQAEHPWSAGLLIEALVTQGRRALA